MEISWVWGLIAMDVSRDMQPQSIEGPTGTGITHTMLGVHEFGGVDATRPAG